MPLALYVAAGGALGALARYLVSTVVARTWTHALPMGTMIVNVTGCFLIGILAGLSHARATVGNEAHAFLVVGILGGYTTFSAFGLEAFELLRRGQLVLAMVHVAGQCVLGTAAVAAGHYLIRARG